MEWVEAVFTAVAKVCAVAVILVGVWYTPDAIRAVRRWLVARKADEPTWPWVGTDTCKACGGPLNGVGIWCYGPSEHHEPNDGPYHETCYRAKEVDEHG